MARVFGLFGIRTTDLRLYVLLDENQPELFLIVRCAKRSVVLLYPKDHCNGRHLEITLECGSRRSEPLQ